MTTASPLDTTRYRLAQHYLNKLRSADTAYRHGQFSSAYGLTLFDQLATNAYSMTTNDFTASGGDGYPNNRSRITTRDILDQDLADYLATVPGGVVSPAIQGRIHCTDSIPGGGLACPVGSP